MWVLRLIGKNAARHKLRSLLTIFGLALAVVAFGVITTALNAWNTQIELIPPDRLVTRHAVSYTFSLPLSYKDRIEQVAGVERVAYANWFGGLYQNDPKNFFANYAIGPEDGIELYPEFVVPEDQKRAYYEDRTGCIAGQKIVDKFGWKIGDVIRLTGQIYPGDWDFTLRGIYRGAEVGTDETSLIFHWKYLDERVGQMFPGWSGQAGWFVVKIADPAAAARVCADIDELFRNSSAQTLTETEKAFSIGFISGLDAIVVMLKVISYLILGVIFLVLANTMLMSARERTNEYALLKTLGFGPFRLAGLIVGESLAIAAMGGLLGILLTFPAAEALGRVMSTFITVMAVKGGTVIMAMFFALLVGILSAVFPTIRALRMPIVDGLRHIG